VSEFQPTGPSPSRELEQTLSRTLSDLSPNSARPRRADFVAGNSAELGRTLTELCQNFQSHRAFSELPQNFDKIVFTEDEGR
jgi:erythromycin esterase-like protein